MLVPVNIFTLKQTAEILSVTVDTLLEWNNSNILKPTITQNGSVGYTREQIVKFLAIRQLSQNTSHALGEQKAFQSGPLVASDENFTSSDLNKYHTSKITNFSKTGNNRPLYFGLITSISFLMITLIAMPFIQQNIQKQSPDPITKVSMEKTNNTKSLSGLEVNETKYFEFSSPPLDVMVKNNNLPGDLNKTNFTVSENILATSSSIFATKSTTTGTQTHNQISALPLYGESDNNDIFENNPVALDVNNATANYASRSDCPTCFKNTETTVLDENGNIKGETTNTELLATTLGTIGSLGMIQKSSLLGQPINPGVLAAFFTLSLLPIVLAFKKQPVTNGSSPSSAIALNSVIDLQPEKILELDQKTDGTVVLYFQGKEHKISKPELNSESDQFIERLLGFTTGNVKEINYDISKDEKIVLNAPLSKLVTRLGFVSLRRDLFFPRTSKNRVLFRKYLTHQDLVSMGITTDRLLNELVC